MATNNNWNNSITDANVTFTGGTMDIGTDSTDNAINIGTAASAGRTTTLGNTTGTSTTAINSGSGGIALTTGTNGDVTLAPNGSGVVSVTAAPVVPSTDRADSLGSTTNSWDNVYCDGVSFDDGTNVLSTYTASTSWTPVLDFGTGVTGITYSTQAAEFTQIGNLKWIRVRIVLTSKGTDTGVARITGVPTGSAATSSTIGSIISGNITFSGTQLVPLINGSNIFIGQLTSGGASANLTNSAFANNSNFNLSIIYI